MKKIIWSICLTCSIAFSQHRGNFADAQLETAYGNSRANIAQYQGYQYQPVAMNPQAYLRLDLKALYNIEADNYTAVFNVIQIGTTADSTSMAMKQRTDAIELKLAQAGITRNQIAYDIISFKPVYTLQVERKLFSKKYVEVPNGFQMQQNIMIQFSDSKKFNQIMSACAASEVYDIVKVDYYVEDIDTYYLELQNRLLKMVENKRDYYKALGFDLSTYNVTMADNQYYHFPKMFYKSYQAAQSVSMEALEGKRHVTTVEKPITYYYEPIPYNDYDIVVNASILEPVVQIGFDLTLQFIPKPPTPEPAPVPGEPTPPKYYVISPTGPLDIQELPTEQ